MRESVSKLSNSVEISEPLQIKMKIQGVLKNFLSATFVQQKFVSAFRNVCVHSLDFHFDEFDLEGFRNFYGVAQLGAISSRHRAL